MWIQQACGFHDNRLHLYHVHDTRTAILRTIGIMHHASCVEIELARLVIRSLLVQYLSFSSTLMFPSMHHTDIHTF